MELQLSCEAQPDFRSWLSFRRPPLRRGSTRGASPLPLPLAHEERRGAADKGGRRSRAQEHRLRQKVRTFRWTAFSRGGPSGLADKYWITVAALRTKI